MDTTEKRQRFYNAFATVAAHLLTWGMAAVVTAFYIWGHM